MSYRKWDIDSDRIKKPIIKKFILQFLASDFARPKKFSEIWKFMSRRKICTKITLCVYLEGLEKKDLIKKIKEHKKDKRFVYVLSDWKKHREYMKEYEKRMIRDVKKLAKEVDKTIKGIEKGVLTETEVHDYVFCMLTDFEYRQFQGFNLLLLNKPIALFVTPSLIEDFIAIPFNLRVQLLWVCFEKYPKATMDAIELLRKNKEVILRTPEYKDMLSKLGVKTKPLG